MLIFGIMSAFMYFANCYWYAFLIPIISALIIIFIRLTIYWKGLIKPLCFLIAIIISTTGLYYIRPESNVSLRGVIVRESIRSVVQLPKLRNDGIINTGADFAKNTTFWKAPKGYDLIKDEIDSLPVELLIKEDSDRENVILHLHGGAYVIGYMDIYRQIALRYSRISGGADVVSIDYRLAPEHTYPAALEDALKAWDWMLEQGYKEENIIIAGDSAGGNLALALVAKLRDDNRPLPKAMVLMSPWTDLAGEGKSRINNQKKDPLFGNKNGIVNNFDKKSNPYAGDTDLYDKYLSPVYGDFDGFPPMLIQVGTYEILESDSVDVYKKAKAAGVNATLTRYEGMFHVFQLAGYLIPESKQAWNEVEDFLKSQFNE